MKAVTPDNYAWAGLYDWCRAQDRGDALADLLSKGRFKRGWGLETALNKLRDVAKADSPVPYLAAMVTGEDPEPAAGYAGPPGMPEGCVGQTQREWLMPGGKRITR